MNNPRSEDRPLWIVGIMGTTRTASPHFRNPGQSIDKNNIPHAYGYHVQFSGGYYYINFQDMNTMNWINSYTATAAAGTSSFTDLRGSSEYRQRSAPTTNTFSATTNPVKDEWARITNGNWMKPNQVWKYVSPQTSSYVTVTKSFDGSGNLITISNGHYP